MAGLIAQEEEISSVADLMRALPSPGAASKLLFRGQNVDEPLLPKIARGHEVDINVLSKVERQMLDQFKREAHNFIAGALPRTDWDWLSVAQHHGLPTRLLDWSASALAGLWFAIAGELPDNSKHAILWVLSVEQSDLKTPSAETKIFDLSRTYVFQPYHMDRRIAAQSGWFSVHRYSEGSGKFVPLNTNNKYKDRLKRFIIPKTSVVALRHELRVLGVTHATMFPDLAGLCASIQTEFLRGQPNVTAI